MKRIVITLVILALLLVAGCQSGDIKVSPVIAGQQAPHAGYNIGPELYLKTGDLVKFTGAVVYIKGLDPNNLESGIQ